MKENCCDCELTYNDDDCGDCEIKVPVMKYKVGDTPLIKSPLPYYTSTHYTVGEMQQLEGQTATIIKVNRERGTYQIKEDSGNWAWDDEMFEDPARDQE